MMKMNKACRLLGDRVDELADEAEKVKVGLSGLLDVPSALSPDRLVESSFGEAATWIGEAVQDMSERLRRLNDVIAELNDRRTMALSASGRPAVH
jgi:prefoldin subunit 5